MGRLYLRRIDKARAPTGLAKELILSGYGPTIRHRENKRGPRQIEANETKRKLTYEPGENTRLSTETFFVDVILSWNTLENGLLSNGEKLAN